jgi:hypothetical protein
MKLKINLQTISVTLLIIFVLYCLGYQIAYSFELDSIFGFISGVVTIIFIILCFLFVVAFSLMALAGDFNDVFQKEISINIPTKSDKDKLLSEYGQACIENNEREQDRLYQILKEKNYL